MKKFLDKLRRGANNLAIGAKCALRSPRRTGADSALRIAQRHRYAEGHRKGEQYVRAYSVGGMKNRIHRRGVKAPPKGGYIFERKYASGNREIYRN